MENSALSEKNDISSIKNDKNMNADLGLFNQLLQMVDGDWSDSIQGICSHIQERFNALGVILSIFDKSFKEFIFIEYTISEKLNDQLQKSQLKLSQSFVADIIKKIYNERKDILDFNIFNKNDLNEFFEIYFEDKNKSTLLTESSDINNAISIPVLSTNNNYQCIFHILTEKHIDKIDQEMINDYLKQLNIALEIVFLVRELYIKATHDCLTKLFNHKQGRILLHRELNRVIRNKQPLTIVMLDIDFFKKVNDNYGHQAGDIVLEYIGTLLADSMRKCDIISRYGGEEFLIVLPDTNLNNSIDVIKRLKDTIQYHKFNHNGQEFNVTASFGMAQYDGKKHLEITDLVENADQNLYKAKNSGRNRIEY